MRGKCCRRGGATLQHTVDVIASFECPLGVALHMITLRSRYLKGLQSTAMCLIQFTRSGHLCVLLGFSWHSDLWLAKGDPWLAMVRRELRASRTLCSFPYCKLRYHTVLSRSGQEVVELHIPIKYHRI
jgi:hypothetical protein